jgi:hypothetical protein
MFVRKHVTTVILIMIMSPLTTVRWCAGGDAGLSVDRYGGAMVIRSRAHCYA